MHHIFSPAILTANNVCCPKCKWKGTGTDIKQEELFLTDAIELYCPSCNGYLGFVSEPEQNDH
jgi:DnaJ-class molecular chaperone